MSFVWGESALLSILDSQRDCRETIERFLQQDKSVLVVVLSFDKNDSVRMYIDQDSPEVRQAIAARLARWPRDRTLEFLDMPSNKKEIVFNYGAVPVVEGVEESTELAWCLAHVTHATRVDYKATIERLNQLRLETSQKPLITSP